MDGQTDGIMNDGQCVTVCDGWTNNLEKLMDSDHDSVVLPTNKTFFDMTIITQFYFIFFTTYISHTYLPTYLHILSR